jgi:hypothetical protein
MDTSKKAANLLYNAHTDDDCKFLALQWAVDDLIANIVADNIESAYAVYDRLESGGYTIHNQYEYNDLDNHAYIVSWDHKFEKAFVITDQNRNFLYRIRNDGDFNKKQMFIYTFRNMNHLSKLQMYGRSKYNDMRDDDYLCGSPDVIIGRAPDCPAWQMGATKHALMCLNSIYWDE